MNREFKFRAWHSQQKRMIDVYGLGPDFVTENTLDGVDPGTNAFMGDDFKLLTIMQSTGLKDDCDQEVYEDDIFEGEEHGEYYVAAWNKEEARFQLEYYGYDIHTGEGGQEVYGSELSLIDYYEITLVCSLKVIGNVHQNPELL